MKINPEMMRLYAVTDRHWLGRKTLAQQVEEALKGGVTCVQLREKNLDFDSFLKEAIELKKICSVYHVPLLINDNIQIALKSGADGVHIGQNDMPVEEARKLLGEDKIIGVTAKTIEQALEAQNHGADYLGSGAMFASSTKTDAIRIDYETFRGICQAVEIPVVAIGGITKENISQIAGLGMDGIAVITAIFSAPDIQQACQELRELSEQIVCDIKK
ncbi:MAG: thiamine phosphate synthase [Ruminococcus sp.]|nr:thiamine phosphate synthase [Ruminococcus sp.]